MTTAIMIYLFDYVRLKDLNETLLKTSLAWNKIFILRLQRLQTMTQPFLPCSASLTKTMRPLLDCKTRSTTSRQDWVMLTLFSPADLRTLNVVSKKPSTRFSFCKHRRDLPRRLQQGRRDSA